MTASGDWLDQPPYGMAPPLVARMRAIAEEMAVEWHLRLGPRLTAGRYSYVAFAGEDAVLKVIPPQDDDADHIAEALRLWDGDGAVRLLRHDPRRRALLLERLRPGTEAASLPDDEATAVAVAVGRRIWRPVPVGHPFRSLSDWVRRWMSPDERHPLVPVARRTYESFTPKADRLVHADFHHHNLLRRGDEWVAIDPKPFVGEPEFDILPFLANPIGSEPTRTRVERQIRSFVDAGLDGDRIRQWSIVRGILDGLPDPGQPEPARMRIARMLI